MCPCVAVPRPSQSRWPVAPRAGSRTMSRTRALSAGAIVVPVVRSSIVGKPPDLSHWTYVLR